MKILYLFLILILVLILIFIVFPLIKTFVYYYFEKYLFKYDSLDKRYSGFIDEINDFAFNGEGTIIYVTKTVLNLYKEGSNQIVFFHYGGSFLKIRWLFKWFHQETKFIAKINTEYLNDKKNQHFIAKDMIKEAIIYFDKHKRQVENKM